MTPPAASDDWKRAAAVRAVGLVEDGMVVGLGSGSTAGFALDALAGRVAGGLRVAGIPTSELTAARARQLGIPLTDFAAHRRIDLTIDGADQVSRSGLDLVKGLGGALLREKIVAAASRRLVVVADRSKLVERLGARTPLPVEIVAFGWQVTLERLAGLGCRPALRRSGERPFVTDGGNLIAHCSLPEIADPAGLEVRLKGIPGVVETGLFLGMASQAVIAGEEGVEVIER